MCFNKDKDNDYKWVCNYCDFSNFTNSVSQEEIEQELHACINCGGLEFHKEYETTNNKLNSKISVEDEILLHTKFLNEFCNNNGTLKSCNPDAIFNWFAWKLWRSK